MIPSLVVIGKRDVKYLLQLHLLTTFSLRVHYSSPSSHQTQVPSLDVGTGDAAQLLAIKSKHPHLSLFACDNDLTYQSIFDLYPDISFQQTTSLEQLQDYFSRCSPEYISFFEVLEHIPECEIYLLSSLKAASKGVFLVCQTLDISFIASGSYSVGHLASGLSDLQSTFVSGRYLI